jgi:uncharacterized protein YihD (DUF1040 family)
MGFFQYLRKFIKRFIYTTYRLQENVDDIKVLHGKLLAQAHLQNLPALKKDIRQAEFKVFSQWGDDGIIQFLVSYLDIPTKTFIEFGVEDYSESNTRFLLINNNWKGVVLDGNPKDIQYIQEDEIYWRHDLTAKQVFVTAENINQVIKESGFTGEIGLLHIDIDGNDYWVWKSIEVVNPIIVIVEYNSVFGMDRAITVPYNPSFDRTEAHYTNLYFGASLKALVQLGEMKEYYFIGCNSNGNNAYFVRRDKIKDLEIKSIQEGYVASRFRESVDKKGNRTFITGENRIELLRGLTVVNTETGAIEKIMHN